MAKVRVRKKHQITIPARIVESANIRLDDMLEVSYNNVVVTLSPVSRNIRKQSAMAYAGIARRSGMKQQKGSTQKNGEPMKILTYRIVSLLFTPLTAIKSWVRTNVLTSDDGVLLRLYRRLRKKDRPSYSLLSNRFRIFSYRMLLWRFLPGKRGAMLNTKKTPPFTRIFRRPLMRSFPSVSF